MPKWCIRHVRCGFWAGGAAQISPPAAARCTIQICAVLGGCTTKHVSKSMAWFSSGLLPSRRGGGAAGCGSGEGGRGEEALRRRHQLVDAPVQPVGRDRVLEQAPDPLDRIVLMRTIFGQP